jgi:hypothetical protein
MSAKERDRLKVVAALTEGRLKQVEAARLMKLTVRHVRRLQERYDTQGDAGLVHGSRGRPSNRRTAATTVRRVLNEEGSPPEGLSPETAEADVESQDEADAAKKRVVTAKYPNHVWHVDLTAVPIAGFWVPWPPFTLPQVWPFCWWVA